mgnify:CR=1 FL=1
MGASAAANRNNIIQFRIIDGKKCEKKCSLNGSVNSHSNKKSGESSEVFAFRTEEEIKAMIDVFNRHIENASDKDKARIAYRNKMLFLIGISVGIRASDLRTLKWSFFFSEPGKFRTGGKIKPKKTRKSDKYVPIYISDTVKTVINDYISKYAIDDYDTYLFTSRKSTGRKRKDDDDISDSKGNMPIAESSIWRIINNAAAEAGIRQNIGSHSLRKTFGYWVWHNAKNKEEALVHLQVIFNHSSTSVTKKYIGITDDEIKDVYDSIDFGVNFI